MSLTTHEERLAFQAAAQAGPDSAGLAGLAARIKAAGPMAAREDKLALAAALAHAAFAAPDRIGVIYDGLAEGWLGRSVNAAPVASLASDPLTIPDSLWPDYWRLAEDATQGLDAGEITARTAALGGLFGPEFLTRVGAAAFAYPGVDAAAERPFPPMIDVETLAPCPLGSVGAALYRLIVDNKFDLEVLDRNALGLSGLPKPLDYLNVRILQAHDLWHLVAGYDTTALHEIAISAFQMAQFGHSYSSQFLAVVAATAAIGDPMGFAMLGDVVFTAYAHGRETPPMLDIAWEEVWDEPVEAIRARHGVTPYPSPYPADLIEQLQAMRAA
jgi:ubiquinone biosynthesis protein Coq4